MRVGLIVALALMPSLALAGGKAELVGVFDLTRDVTYFGGLSGVEFSDDGSRFTALSDSAVLFSGEVDRNGKGGISALHLDERARFLHWPNGENLKDPTDDSEGLAISPDGRVFISFELHDRVAEIATDGTVIADLPRPRDFDGFEYNAGLEGLALAPDGTLYTMPEGDGGGVRSFPVFRYRDGHWDVAFRLPEDHTWRPVGADFGPDGRLFIVERDYWGLLGFMTRIRRITFDDTGVIADEVLFESRAGQLGNLEGLSAWQDGEGATRLTLVSDNNFLPLLSGAFADFRVTD